MINRLRTNQFVRFMHVEKTGEKYIRLNSKFTKQRQFKLIDIKTVIFMCN